VGDTEVVNEFPRRFPHLINPFLHERLFFTDSRELVRAHALDVHNMLVRSQHTPEWRARAAPGVRKVAWAADDPLADTFLMQHGAYPEDEIGRHYSDILFRAEMEINIDVDKHSPIPADIYDHPSLGYLTRHGIRRHYSIRSGWDYPGFFVGESADLDDLVRFWNIRAADIPLHFVDPAHLTRYAAILPEIDRRLRADQSHLDEHRRKVAVWSRADKIEEALRLFSNQSMSACQVSEHFWRGGTVRPPMMILGEASSLGVFGNEKEKTKVSFSLSDRPFSGDPLFYTQHLVASISLYGGDEQQTFRPPYVPELNEFFARAMHFRYNRLRVEPERVGVIIDAASHDSFLYALPVPALVEQLFGMIGLRAKLSGGGLITRQLIARLGGVNGARVFKIPGVRRLLKKFGPTESFTKAAALSLIGGRDEENPQANFKDHEQLYIEPRAIGTLLTPTMVFTYLVDKGLLRIGAKLTCPTCALASWIPLDELKQSNVCSLCGAAYDGTRQLVSGAFHYRRTGVLGLEKNSQGAVPVALVLQQLDTNLGGLRHGAMLAPSYDLEPVARVDLPKCEVDLVEIIPDTYPDPAQIILGECKDEGQRIDANDIENLRRIADALPVHRFETFILFARLSPFSPEEIALAKTLNAPYHRRVILLTARELEPYHIYERTQKETGITSHGDSPQELAAVTAHLYFEPSTPSAGAAPAGLSLPENPKAT
jgi:hypothetical protein